MLHLGGVPASSALYIPFETVDGTGAGVTISGFAVGDIKIYKNGSTTERASTSGFALLDTDGIDFDGVTGLHGFSIDLSDNSDAGFYSVGAQYWVILNTITLSGVAITPLIATFRIVAAEAVAGKPKVDVDAFGGSAGTFSGGRPEVNASHWAGTATTLSGGLPDVNMKTLTAGIIAAASFASGALDAVWSTTTRLLTAGTNIVLVKGTGITGFNDLSAAQVNAEADTALADVGVTTIVTGRIDAAVSTRLAASAYTAPLDAAGVRGAVGMAAANMDTQLSNIANSVASTGAGVTNVQTTVNAIEEKTDNLPSDPADQSLIIDATTAIMSRLGAPAGASVSADIASRASQASVDDLPTNAELATALDGADDAVLAAIAALNNLSAADVNAEVDIAISDAALATAASLATTDGKVDAVKAKTDNLAFTSGAVDSNIAKVNGVTVTGTGTTGNEWGPA
ncbi:hypothetical protein [Mesorhizobium captivum]|uniref:hypothetical protein n=1 Tax=Mesorhizobium captivum TaxID=3072319 RepID=UPI002A23F409|nr:hypothetical protein [Mesorhizobium sp. VK23E]MDX8513531.1 hypothetical protein [Mesorhizobium sp. VK23E]